MRPASGVTFKWTSRNNRKGRHAIVVKASDAADAGYEVPPFSNTLSEVAKGIWRMFTYYPVWDVSWLTAYTFTIGSIVWVINGFFSFLPLLESQLATSEALTNGAGITAFIGATVFEIGSVFLMLEAVNTNKTGCFGWALHDLVSEDGHTRVVRAVPSSDACTHHHLNKANLVGSPRAPTADPESEQTAKAEDSHASWEWWPTTGELRGHFMHDLGFIASLGQMVGASIFWISGFTALPGVLGNLSPAATIGAYWVMQTVGGSFFIFSGTMFMLETQKHWWMPALGTLGWHIGFWNLIGGVGFTICACFGLDPAEWSQYQAACSTFWGMSWPLSWPRGGSNDQS